MSATLGDDGTSSSCFGVKDIEKLPVRKGWDRRGTGRRLILFPGVAPLETQRCGGEAAPKRRKSLILVPDDRTGFDRGVNTFHLNDVTLPEAIVVGRIDEDKRQYAKIHEVLPVDPCHALGDDQV
jgi:hypothetical protein